MEQERADALISEIIGLVMEAVREVLPRYVGLVVAAKVVREVQQVIEQEWISLLGEDREDA